MVVDHTNTEAMWSQRPKLATPPGKREAPLSVVRKFERVVRTNLGTWIARGVFIYFSDRSHPAWITERIQTVTSKDSKAPMIEVGEASVDYLLE